MFPVIRVGDELVLEPREIDQINEGEIAAFITAKQIAAHRVIGRGQSKGKPCVFTKGDNNKDSGEIVTHENLVGVVVQVERNGKIFIPKPLHLSPLHRIFNTIWLKLHSFWIYKAKRFLLIFWAGVRLFVLQCIDSRLRNQRIPEKIQISFDMSSSVKFHWLSVIRNAEALVDPLIAQKVFFGDWQVTFNSGEEVLGFFTFHRSKEHHPKSAFLSHVYVNADYWRTPTSKHLLVMLDAYCRLIGITAYYAAAKTLSGKRLLKDLKFKPVVLDHEIKFDYFFEYLGPQSHPIMYSLNKARWTLKHSVSDLADREADLNLLGIE